MWNALKPFRYRGVAYRPGDEVPAHQWPNRKALVAMRRIKQTFESPTETLDTVASSGTVNLSNMKRDDLNQYATSLGLENPESYGTKAELIEALTPKDDDSPPDGDDSTEDQVSDNLWGESDIDDSSDEEEAK